MSWNTVGSQVTGLPQIDFAVKKNCLSLKQLIASRLYFNLRLHISQCSVYLPISNDGLLSSHALTHMLRHRCCGGFILKQVQCIEHSVVHSERSSLIIGPTVHKPSRKVCTEKKNSPKMTGGQASRKYTALSHSYCTLNTLWLIEVVPTLSTLQHICMFWMSREMLRRSTKLQLSLSRCTVMLVQVDVWRLPWSVTHTLTWSLTMLLYSMGLESEIQISCYQ